MDHCRIKGIQKEREREREGGNLLGEAAEPAA
jgi:hypothetical protein